MPFRPVSLESGISMYRHNAAILKFPQGNHLSSTALWIAIAVIGVLLVVKIKNAFWIPLKYIPGPWYARYTGLVLKKNVVEGQRVHYVHALHRQYGPVVRIAPNEVDVADPRAFKEIRKIGGGFLKDSWYLTSRQGHTADIFQLVNPKEHAERRRLFAPLWTNTALHTNWEGTVTEKLKLAVAKIKRDALAGESDVLKWWHFMATDVISHLAFGESVHMLLRESATELTEDLDTAAVVGPALAEVPWLESIIKILPVERIRHAYTASDRVHKYAHRAVTNAKQGTLTNANVFSRIIAESDKNGFTDYQVSHEAEGLILAGSGTTAVTLTYLVWAVLNDRQIQDQLEHEVGKLGPGFTDSDVEKLPYLSATIDETLRLYGAAPGALPRRPPKGGANLGGYFIPEGTTVCTQAFTMHRDEKIYQDAEKFDPSKFLTPEGVYVAPNAMFAPFGAGTRTCLGMHLAKMELRLGATEFFRECRGARVADTMKNSEMDILNYFLISPAGGRCCITLASNLKAPGSRA